MFVYALGGWTYCCNLRISVAQFLGVGPSLWVSGLGGGFVISVVSFRVGQDLFGYWLDAQGLAWRLAVIGFVGQLSFKRGFRCSITLVFWILGFGSSARAMERCLGSGADFGSSGFVLLGWIVGTWIWNFGFSVYGDEGVVGEVPMLARWELWGDYGLH